MVKFTKEEVMSIKKSDSPKLPIKNLCDFKNVVKQFSFSDFWGKFIQSYTYKSRPDLVGEPSLFDIDLQSPDMCLDNIGELYEISLEINNKISKKEMGKYFTPKDVAKFMAHRLLENFNIKTDSLADVCCGTGNLIIEVLSLLNANQIEMLIKNNRIHLYDIDEEALKLALMKIAIIFIKKGDIKTYQQLDSLINICCGNFLDSKIELAPNSVVISNPPYGKIPSKLSVEKNLITYKDTNEMYAVFMEKIALQCKRAVIITPQSFLGGDKFSSLRSILSKFGGSVFSFDNVPATIFTGRKKGIFNTNTANSVRAAITMIDKTEKGFIISPMLRFNCDEREFLFDNADKLLGHVRYSTSEPWLKVPKTLEPLASKLPSCSYKVKDLLTDLPIFQDKKYKINIPTTPRYFITGSHKELNRSSCIEIFAKDEKSFYLLYAMINSSLSYLWWRMYDGGITLKKSTLLNLPVPNLSINSIKEAVEDGLHSESKFLVCKLNSGKNNENIKFPASYRKRLNDAILSNIGLPLMGEQLFSVHSNSLKKVFQFWS